MQSVVKKRNLPLLSYLSCHVKPLFSAITHVIPWTVTTCAWLKGAADQTPHQILFHSHSLWRLQAQTGNADRIPVQISGQALQGDHFVHDRRGRLHCSMGMVCKAYSARKRDICVCFSCSCTFRAVYAQLPVVKIATQADWQASWRASEFRAWGMQGCGSHGQSHCSP